MLMVPLVAVLPAPVRLPVLPLDPGPLDPVLVEQATRAAVAMAPTATALRMSFIAMTSTEGFVFDLQ
jgi:hypothetical protein